MLLRSGRKAHHRNVLRSGEHERRARRHLADLEAPGGDHRHAVDVRTAGLEFQLDAFLLVEPHRLGADLADLVSREQPAELRIDDGRPCAPASIATSGPAPAAAAIAWRI